VSPPAHLPRPLDGGGSGRVGDGGEHDVAGSTPARRHRPRPPQLLRALAVRDGALDGAVFGPGAAAPLQHRRPEEEPVGVVAAGRRRGGRAQRRDARCRRRRRGHEAHPADDAGEGLAVVVADLLIRRPRAVDDDAAAGARGGGQEEGPDVVPGSPPARDHLEPPGPSRLLGRHRRLAVAVPRLCIPRLLQQPPHELQPRRQDALVEELVRRRRERLLLPAALELEAGRGGRRKRRRGRRGEVHVDVVVLDHHRAVLNLPALGWLEGRRKEKLGGKLGIWTSSTKHGQRGNGWRQEDFDGFLQGFGLVLCSLSGVGWYFVFKYLLFLIYFILKNNKYLGVLCW
jgi:hypothetical protein